MPFTNPIASTTHNTLSVLQVTKTANNTKDSLIRENAKSFAINNMKELIEELYKVADKEEYYDLFVGSRYPLNIPNEGPYFKGYFRDNRGHLIDIHVCAYVLDVLNKIDINDETLQKKVTDIVINHFVCKEITEEITSYSDRQNIYRDLSNDFDLLFRGMLREHLDEADFSRDEYHLLF